MRIFIRGDGRTFTRSDLLGLVEGGLRGPWYVGFRSRGRISACHILRIMDVSGRRSEYHGLVDVTPGKAAWGLIQKLEGRRLRGDTVEVRRWFERDERDNRRSIGGLLQYPEDAERRAATERRRLVRVQFLDELPAVLRSRDALARGLV